MTDQLPFLTDDQVKKIQREAIGWGYSASPTAVGHCCDWSGRKHLGSTVYLELVLPLPPRITIQTIEMWEAFKEFLLGIDAKEVA